MRRISDIYFYCHINTVFVALVFCMGAEHVLWGRELQIITPVHLLLSGGILLVYNLHLALRNIYRKHPIFNASALPSNQLPHLLFAIIGIFSIMGSFFFLSNGLKLIFMGGVIVSLAYTLPMLPLGFKKRLRENGTIKILMLSIAWTLIPTMLPLIEYGTIPIQFIPFLLQTYLLVFSTCLFFDRRDIADDNKRGLKTFAIRLGANNSLILSVALGMSPVVFNLFVNDTGFTGALITSIYAGMAYWLLRNNFNAKRYLFFVDGIILMYGITMLTLH